MAEKGLQKSFETPGLFWLPEKPDDKLSGSLKYTSGEGSQVTLIGGFSFSISPHLMMGSVPVVHGILDNAPCTLFNCGYTAGKSSQGGLHQTIIEADLVLVGEHVVSLDDAVFDGLKVRFSTLDEWVNFSAITISSSDWRKIGGPSQFDLATQPSIEAKAKEIGATIKLTGQHTGHFGHRDIDWEYHSFFEIALDKPTSVRVLLGYAFELQHLLALLTWHRCYISHLSVSRPIAKNAESASIKKLSSGVYGDWPVGSDRRRSSPHLLTYFAHVAAGLPQIVSSWFQSAQTIKTARHLLTSIIQSEGQFLEFKFLALMQTVEGLHRSLDPRTYMSIESYETVRNALVAAIPGNVVADHRATLESRIRYGNDLSLRTRFKELFLRLPESLNPHVCADWKAFVKRAVDIRNALTHPNTDGVVIEPTPDELWQASQRIKLLLTILFLHEIGLSFETVEKIAKEESWQSRTRD